MYAKNAFKLWGKFIGEKKIHSGLLYARMQPLGQDVPQSQVDDKKIIHTCPVLMLLPK